MGMVIDLDKCVGCQPASLPVRPRIMFLTAPWRAKNEEGDLLAQNDCRYNGIPSYQHRTHPNALHALWSCSMCHRMPVKATYHREDGIVVQDYRRCLGVNTALWPVLMGQGVSIAKNKKKSTTVKIYLPIGVFGALAIPSRTHGCREVYFCFHRIDQGLKKVKE